MKYFIPLLTLVLLFTTLQCKKKKDDSQAETFKKETILQNLADNYIIPGYNDLQLKINDLNNSWNVFVSNQTLTNFENTRSAWQEASVSFQKVKFHEVGPAMTINLNAALGTFPADTLQIQSNVTSGNYDLTTAANSDAVGFDALDYLFYGSDAYNKLINSSNRRDYVSDLIAKMKSEANQVVNGWNTYRSTFIDGTGTSTTSPFSVMVNAFCKDYEIAKSAKIGIPIGTTTLGIHIPSYFEARRSGIGKRLLEENLKALHTFFLGNSYTGVSGTGFDDYLIAIERSGLSSTIDTRFSYMESQPANWSGTIENTLTTNPQTLTDFYQYMQATVVYLKTDMSSAFGVLITYEDTDGD